VAIVRLHPSAARVLYIMHIGLSPTKTTCFGLPSGHRQVSSVCCKSFIHYAYPLITNKNDMFRPTYQISSVCFKRFIHYEYLRITNENYTFRSTYWPSSGYIRLLQEFYKSCTRHIRKVRAVCLYLNIGGSKQSCTHAAPSIECLRSH